jgi:hypothetical protein
MTGVTLGKSRVRESCMPRICEGEAEWPSYSTVALRTGPITRYKTGQITSQPHARNSTLQIPQLTHTLLRYIIRQRWVALNSH